MSMRWAIEQLNSAMREQVRQKLASGGGTARTVRQLDEPNRKSIARVQAKSPNKYNARRVIDDGLRFDSQHEHRCYCALKIRQRAGEIEGLRCQVKFALFDPGENCRGEYTGTYRADFVFRENGKLVVADAKSAKTRTLREWPRTKALLRMCHGHEVVEL